MAALDVERAEFPGKWNYSICRSAAQIEWLIPDEP
jgi:hypothetical protein